MAVAVASHRVRGVARGIAPVQFACAAIVAPYLHLAYRVRGWGTLPHDSEPTLLVSNHQNDLDSLAVPTELVLHAGRPVFWVVTRRNFEPGFMAAQYPALAPLLRDADWSGFYRMLGMLPIENHLRARSIGSLAWALRQRHGDLPLTQAFSDDALAPFAGRAAVRTLDDVRSPRAFGTAFSTKVSMRSLREPYRRELLEATRDGIERDFERVESTLRLGGTVYLTPEGGYTSDGRMRPMLRSLRRLAALARVVVVPISYDPFVGKRLSLLYRIVAPDDPDDIETSLKAARPVTTSQVVADYLTRGAGTTFNVADAKGAVRERVRALPPRAFVDPRLRVNPDAATAAAVGRLAQLGLISKSRGRYRVQGGRHPRFPHVGNIVTHQANCYGETLAALDRANACERY
jgi:1-acyl-sn-glycerol-3-phosphate acyltransferase